MLNQYDQKIALPEFVSMNLPILRLSMFGMIIDGESLQKAMSIQRHWEVMSPTPATIPEVMHLVANGYMCSISEYVSTRERCIVVVLLSQCRRC
mmetsp:Transcript_31798/g.43069  ORF Transcript_31798/g.43069 Transcript_31798/m.43069 type:complete len:94 (+) Transcript_31798:764-1045(+)